MTKGGMEGSRMKTIVGKYTKVYIFWNSIYLSTNYIKITNV